MNSSYQLIRNFLLDEISEVVKLPDNVFEDAIVETIIMRFQKNSKVEEANVIRYHNNEKVDSIDTSKAYKTPKKSWEIYKEAKFNIYITKPVLSILTKVKDSGTELKELADFTLGITPYDKYKGHSHELIKNKEFHSEKKTNSDYKPLIKGENILPYYVSNKVSGFIKYGSWLGAQREERFFTTPRIIVRQIISGRPPKIYAGYTDEQLYFTQIGFGIIVKKEISNYELLALLNSKLINFYHKNLHLDLEKELFQKILIENCKNFPVKCFSNKEALDSKVNQILALKKADHNADTSTLEAEIDQLVYKLYDLTEEEIAIVEDSVK